MCTPSPPHACADGDRGMMYLQHVCFLLLTRCWTTHPQQLHCASPAPSQQKTCDSEAFSGPTQHSSPSLMVCTEEPPTRLPQTSRNLDFSLIGAGLALKACSCPWRSIVRGARLKRAQRVVQSWLLTARRSGVVNRRHSLARLARLS